MQCFSDSLDIDLEHYEPLLRFEQQPFLLKLEEEVPDKPACDRNSTVSPSPKGQPRKRAITKLRDVDLKNLNKGHWSEAEKQLYHLFLELYHVHFEERQLRRIDKIFKVMAQFISTRAADQCRSHHQKMENRYKSFHNILKGLRVMHYGTDQACRVKAELARLGEQYTAFEVISLDSEPLVKLEDTASLMT